MNSLFNMDNGVFTFLGKAFDIMLIGFVYLLCCIPIITIGPATTALYYTIVKVIRKNRGYLMREFFKSFKDNFKVGTISWFIVLLFITILYFNIQLTKQMTGILGVVLSYTYISASIMLFCTTIYLFPVLSRFKLGVFGLFKTSFFIAIKHLPSTILLALLTLLFAFASYIIIILIVIAPAVGLYVGSFLYERIFKKYIPKQEESDEDVKIDQWYFD